MLRLIETDLYGGTQTVRQEICDLVAAGTGVTLLVPEQQTVIAEGEMAALLPGEAPLYFEATNFTRLANTVFRDVGGLAGGNTTPGKRALVMWQTLTELSPLLPSLSRRGNRGCEVTPGLVEKAMAAVNEMQSLGIEADELAEAAEAGGLQDRRLCDKLRDLSRIMALYHRLLQQTLHDSDDALLRLCEQLRGAPASVRGRRFYLEGFTSFTEPQYRVIEALLSLTNVTVVLTLPASARDAFEYTEIQQARERLLRLADRAGVEKRRTVLPPATDPARAYLRQACSLLWRSRGEIDKNCLHSSETLRLLLADNPYEACDYVAADIRRRVMAGERYRDFAIVLRDMNSYTGILDVALSKADIPAFLSRRRDACALEIVKMIRAAFAAVSGGFAREDVVAYAKCSLCGVERGAVDEWELYVETWQISGRRFTDRVAWSMNPRGYQAERDRTCEAQLTRLNATREQLLSPLLALAEQTRGRQSVRRHAAALFAFLQQLQVEQQLSDKAERLLLLGEQEAAQDTARVYETVCDALDDLCEVMGECEVDASTFLAVWDVLLSYTDIGHIPSYLDTVTVGAADQLRLCDKKHVYLLGVDQGVFPAAVSEGVYFTERDRTTLSSLGLAIAPECERRRARELYIFSRAFAAAAETVTLIANRHDATYAIAQEADVFPRITEITGGEVQPRLIAALPPEERFFTPEYALEHPLSGADRRAVQRALTDCGYGAALRQANESIRNDDLQLQADTVTLLHGAEIPLSQTKLESYRACPLSYCCHYYLHLDEGRRATFDPSHIGTFVHAVLERFFHEWRERGTAAADMTAEQRRELVRRSAEAHLCSVFEGVPERSPRMQAMIGRLVRATEPVVDGLCQELTDSQFAPVFFELPIRDEDPTLPSAPAFPLPDGRIARIRGAIDRVDTCRIGDDVYVRVVDYKTGKKSFDPDKLAEGKDLQMLLYLKAIVETEKPAFRAALGVPPQGRLIPAGVIYVKVALSGVSVAHADAEAAREAVQQLQKRDGMVLNDPVCWAAMRREYLPIKFNSKNSDIVKSTSEKNLYTEQRWQELDAVISDTIARITGRMCSGDIRAVPLKQDKNTPCTYCRYQAICRHPILS